MAVAGAIIGRGVASPTYIAKVEKMCMGLRVNRCSLPPPWGITWLSPHHGSEMT